VASGIVESRCAASEIAKTLVTKVTEVSSGTSAATQSQSRTTILGSQRLVLAVEVRRIALSATLSANDVRVP